MPQNSDMSEQDMSVRKVPSVHGLRRTDADPEFEQSMAAALRADPVAFDLDDLYGRFAIGDGAFDALMRKAIFKAGAKSCGPGLRVESSVTFKHLETFEIEADVFIGAQAVIQGRYDGRCIISEHAWIGPQVFLDARNLFIGKHVGLGPGARILGSQHTGFPLEVPITETDLAVSPVRIEDWADIGINAVVLPGVRIGKGAIVGAGAVVTDDVAPFSIVAGVPARFMRWRKIKEQRDTE